MKRFFLVLSIIFPLLSYANPEKNKYQWDSVSGWASECYEVRESESGIQTRKQVDDKRCEKPKMEYAWASMSGRTSECYEVDSQTKGKFLRILRPAKMCPKPSTVFSLTSLPGSGKDCYEVDSETMGSKLRLPVDAALCIRTLDPNSLVMDINAGARSPAVITNGFTGKHLPIQQNKAAPNHSDNFNKAE